MTQDHDAKQLDLDGKAIGLLFKVTIRAKRPEDGERSEDDQAVDVSGHHETKRVYKLRAGTWREAIDKAMDLYPVTVEDGTRYTMIAEEA